MRMTAEQMLQRSHVALMRSKQFCLLSAIVMCGTSKIDETCPTAYTDGWNKRYGRKFFEKLTDKQRNAVVAHENFHVMLRQLTVWMKLWKEDAKCANMAADYVINLMIEELDPRHEVTELPKDALLDKKFSGMNTKQVFDILRQQQKQGGGGGGKGQGKGQSQGQGQGGNNTDSGDGQGGADGEPNDGCMDSHGWGNGGEEISEEEQQKREVIIDQAIRQGKIIAGKMGSGGHRAIDELVESKINWRDVLRDFIQSTCAGRDTTTWRRPNRRYLGVDMYMPSSMSEAIGPLVVGIDTSGSIDQAMINIFASELRSICELVIPEKVIVLWWDTSVCGVQEFNPSEYDRIADLLKPAGGGGTNVAVVFDYIEKKLTIKPEACVILTDGYTPYPTNQPDCPVLWGMTTDVKAPWGVSLKIED